MALKGKGIILGVGINDADYAVQKFECYTDGGKKRKRLVWGCPYYQIWSHMIKRCYGKVFTNRSNKTYEDCYVSDKWLVFTNFKAWMEQQPWKGNELDKDILVLGNKCYSEDTCAFVPSQINILFCSSLSRRGEQPIGVYKRREGGYKAGVSKDNKLQYLGQYPTAKLAHKAWQLAKADVVEYMINNHIDGKNYDPRLKISLLNFATLLRDMAEQGLEYKG